MPEKFSKELEEFKKEEAGFYKDDAKVENLKCEINKLNDIRRIADKALELIAYLTDDQIFYEVNIKKVCPDRTLQLLKDKYNKLLARQNKAKEYFNKANPTEVDRYLPHYNKIIRELSQIINTYEQITGVKMTDDELFEGFK